MFACPPRSALRSTDMLVGADKGDKAPRTVAPSRIRVRENDVIFSLFAFLSKLTVEKNFQSLFTNEMMVVSLSFYRYML